MNEELRFFSGFRGKLPLSVDLAGVTYADPDYRITRRLAKVTVLEYVVRGSGFVLREGKARPVGAGEVYLLPQGTPHCYFADRQNPFEKIFLNLSGPLCPSLLQSYGLSGKVFFDGEGLLPIFEKIPAILRSHATEREMQTALQGVFLEILCRLSLSREQEVYSEEALAMKNFLDANVHRKVSAEELAREIFRSPDYCLKRFAREFHTTPYAYQLDQKMQRAKILLAETALPVGEIAEALGYGDLHYFSNLFFRKTGLRPLAYRKTKR